MSKLKIEKGASKIRRTSLKATVDGTIADDLELMCEWSENESSYLVNLLLGFAIAQSEDFQTYKAARSSTPKSGSDASRKNPLPSSAVSPQLEKGASA